KELEEVSKEREKITQKYSGVGKEIEDKEELLKKIREKRRKVYERKLRLQNDFGDEKMKLTRIGMEIKQSEEELGELDVFDEIEQGTIPEMKDRIVQYTRESGALGLLNMKAVEDFEQYRREYEDLKEKVEKIVEEKYAVLKVISEIEGRRKETFTKLFDLINDEFKDIYHKFTGGEAYIALEEEENLYSGLLIKAKPKGKRLLGIDSLSGGEKTVTAIAFLLATQRCKPACFCLLDEIDAALDRENTKKIIEVVKEFSDKQQYIIITHNELTISYSNQVYGVISEGGTSSIVGVKLNKK
ncbi:MAG: AAA family ATPase, partial [Candidatus Aenigmarchaeota archaeon]|nr:AAA family ATPase [Candidatus Aenigmarchaeota archaeon]